MARRSPVFLRAAGAGFAALALVHVVVLYDSLSGVRPKLPPARSFALDPGEQEIEPSAGPGNVQAEDELGPAGEAVGPPVDARSWGDPSSLVCDPHLLRAIRERRHQLDTRAATLAERERMLEVIEKRASELMHALEESRDALEATLAKADDEADAQLTRLVTIYESMKPKDAARLFEAMPADVAAGFVRRMREAKSALIMAHLDANHAYAITLSIANHGRAPGEE
jgi:flagellar motility protein MotE (MotC chaperone)